MGKYRKYSRHSRSHSGNGIWRRFFKYFCITVCVVCGVVVLACWSISLYLTPGRLASIAEREGDKYLDATIKINGIDYTLFRSFPWMNVRMDSVLILSKSLEDLPADLRRSLPSGADSLLFLKEISLKLNVKDLLKREFSLKDVKIVQPSVNAVIADAETNNFTVVKKFPEVKKIPAIKMGEIKLVPPFDIRFFSLPDSAALKCRIENFDMEKPASGNYNLIAEANVEGHYKTFVFPEETEVALNLSAAIGFPTPRVDIEKLIVRIPDNSISISANLDVEGPDILIRECKVDLWSADVLKLLNIVPPGIAQKLHLPEGIGGTLPLQMGAHLLHGYKVPFEDSVHFSELPLPALSGYLKIEGAGISYAPPYEKPVIVDDMEVSVSGVLQPSDTEESFIWLEKMFLRGEGLAATADGKVNNLLGARQTIEAKANLSSNLVKTLSYLLPLGNVKIGGHVDFSCGLSCEMLHLHPDSVRNIRFKISGVSTGLTVASGNNFPSILLKDVKMNNSINLPSFPIEGYKGTKMNLDFQAAGVAISYPGKGQDLDMEGIDLSLVVADTTNTGGNATGVFDLGLKKIRAHSEGLELKAGGIKAGIQGGLASNPPSLAQSFTYPSDENDLAVSSKVAHTPLLLQGTGVGILSDITNFIDADVLLSVNDGSLKTAAYLYPVEWKDVTLSTDLDRMKMAAGEVNVGRSGFSMTMDADNIGNFMATGNPVLIKADASFDFDDVDINQLAWGYYGAALKSGNDSAYYLPPMKPYSAGDSVCVAIPRNIDATINLKSAKAEYLQYTFSPLRTEIIVKDGDATLRNLSIGSPYCNLNVNWTYSTANLSDIFMNLKVNVDPFSFQPFYATFPSLTQKMPELENLSGELYADIDCRFLMYPTMFLNAPSLNAKVSLKGKDLQFNRTGRIERITHLMLIKGDEPIHIDNIDMGITFHDNLLEIKPFKIKFDDYQLSFGGVNNMQGDMYYHFALEKSPFHLPFGVSLEGKMKHPELRIGGTHMDEKAAEKVTSVFQWNPDVNIMAFLKHGWQLFVETASKYAQENER